MFDCLDAAVHRIVAASVPEILEGLTLRATQSAAEGRARDRDGYPFGAGQT